MLFIMDHIKRECFALSFGYLTQRQFDENQEL